MGEKCNININFNFIPNNYQKYIANNNNNLRYKLEKINLKSKINSSLSNSRNSFSNYNKLMNNSKTNIHSKRKFIALMKANSHQKILNINIDSNIKRIKNLLYRNKNLKTEINTGKIPIVKNKSFSERIKKNDLNNLYKKKILISKKHFLINKIPKGNISYKSNRNGLNIPYYYKQIKTIENN